MRLRQYNIQYYAFRSSEELSQYRHHCFFINSKISVINNFVGFGRRDLIMRARWTRTSAEGGGGMRYYCVRFADRKPEIFRPMSYKSANYRIHMHNEYIIRYYNNMCILISHNSNNIIILYCRTILRTGDSEKNSAWPTY